MKSRSGRRAQRGLTLLELLVALSIMALATGVLYRALGSSVRSAGLLHQQQRAVLLAQSLLAAKDTVAEEGWNETGESAGYAWQVSSRPYDTLVSQAHPEAIRLHLVLIDVRWDDAGVMRQVELRTLRPQRRPVVAAAGRGS